MNATAEAANQKNREREAATCLHFRGIQHATCKAECRMDSFPVVPGQGRPLPCMPPFRARPDDVRPTCPKFEAQGMERVLAEEKEWAGHFTKTNTARKAIVEHAAGKRGVAGKLPCPICKTGTLCYSIAGCNGHVHARCSTPDCVAWME